MVILLVAMCGSFRVVKIGSCGTEPKDLSWMRGCRAVHPREIPRLRAPTCSQKPRTREKKPAHSAPFLRQGMQNDCGHPAIEANGEHRAKCAAGVACYAPTRIDQCRRRCGGWCRLR